MPSGILPRLPDSGKQKRVPKLYSTSIYKIKTYFRNATSQPNLFVKTNIDWFGLLGLIKLNLGFSSTSLFALGSNVCLKDLKKNLGTNRKQYKLKWIL